MNRAGGAIGALILAALVALVFVAFVAVVNFLSDSDRTRLMPAVLAGGVIRAFVVVVAVGYLVRVTRGMPFIVSSVLFGLLAALADYFVPVSAFLFDAPADDRPVSDSFSLTLLYWIMLCAITRLSFERARKPRSSETV